jgi:hypothetical protein
VKKRNFGEPKESVNYKEGENKKTGKTVALGFWALHQEF